MDTSVIIALTAPILVLGIAVAILAALLVPFYLHHRTKDRARLYEMLKQAQESDHPFSPDLIRQIVGSQPPTREKDIRRGAILLAIAAGIAIPTVVVFLLLLNLGQMIEEIIPISSRTLVLGAFALLGAVVSVLTCVGGTLLALGFLLRRPDKEPNKT